MEDVLDIIVPSLIVAREWLESGCLTAIIYQGEQHAEILIGYFYISSIDSNRSSRV